MRTRFIVGLLLISSLEAGAQTLTPMTAVRLTTSSGKVTGRIVRADSASVLVELPDGKRRTIARADVISVERHGGRAAKSAKVLGFTGLALGAAMGVLLVEGLCETSNCDGDIPPAMLIGGSFFGGIGVVSGAFLGHNFSWQPVGPTFQVSTLDPLSTCLLHPRVEAQFGNSAGMLGESHSQFNVGAVCGAGTVIGVDFTHLGRTSLRTEMEVSDPVYGPVGKSFATDEARYFNGAFIERPLTTGAVRVAGIAFAGQYRTDRTLTDVSYMKEFQPDLDWRQFNTAYPHHESSSSARSFGGGLGVKASLAIGPQVSLGFASRLHQIGSSRQHVESGFTLSFRP